VSDLDNAFTTMVIPGDHNYGTITLTGDRAAFVRGIHDVYIAFYSSNISKSGVPARYRTFIGNMNALNFEPVDILWGDVNGDGEIDILDLILLRRYLAGHHVDVTPGADVNGDGAIDILDLILLRRYLAGHPVVLGPQGLRGGSDSDLDSMSSDTTQVSVSHVSVASGEYVDVVVRLDVNPGISALSLRLNYDASVLAPITQWNPDFEENLVMVTPGSVIGIPVLPGTRNSSIPLTFETSNFSTVSGTGVLATVRFRVLDTAGIGSTSVTLTDALAIGAGFTMVNVGTSGMMSSS